MIHSLNDNDPIYHEGLKKSEILVKILVLKLSLEGVSTGNKLQPPKPSFSPFPLGCALASIFFFFLNVT